MSSKNLVLGTFSQEKFFLSVLSQSVRGNYTLTHNLSMVNLCMFKKKSSAYPQPVYRCREAGRRPARGHRTSAAPCLHSVWTDFKPAVTLLTGPENQHVVFIQVLVGNRPVKDIDTIGVQVGAALLDQAACRSA